MADWSFGGFKNRIGGLLSDPDKLVSLMNNPMFSGGMGLLSAARDGSVDPFKAAMGGVIGAGDRTRIEQLRKELAVLIEGQQQGGPPNMMGGQQMPSSMAGPMNPGTVNGINGPVQLPGMGQQGMGQPMDSRTQALMNYMRLTSNAMG
jgi:hypothetical protein